MGKMDDQDDRIQTILGDDCGRNSDTLDIYARYLKKTLELPCLLTGLEDFPWEERYVLGGGDKKEYERLKKDTPSFRDLFSALSSRCSLALSMESFRTSKSRGLVR